MSEPEKRTGRIIPAYNGILSDRLTWNDTRLDTLVNKSDLRTTITIKAGEGRSQPNYEDLGDILIWKRVENPMSLFRLGIERTKGQVEVSQALDQGRADVYINHQRVMQDVMDKNKGKFDEKLFAQSFDALTKVGIDNILAREKLKMLARSGLTVGVYTALLGLPTGLAFLEFRGTLTNLLYEIPQQPFSLDIKTMDAYTDYYIPRMIESVMGLRCVIFSLRVLLELKKRALKVMDSTDPYEHCLQDALNPLKPVKNYLQGYWSLKSGAPIVDYEG